MNNLPFRRSGSLSVVQKLPFYYGFVIVFISALGIIASIPGQTMGVSVFTDHFIETLDISRIQISTAYMVGTLSSSFMAPFMGLFYDRKGPRVTSALATIVLAFFLLFLAFSDRILALLSGGLPVDSSIIALVLMTVGFFGIRMSGQGALTMVSRATLARWFSTHRGITSGVLGVITSFSFSYAPRALQGLINHYTAGGAFIAMALLLLVLFLPLSILLYRKDPESCGLKMEQGIPVRRKKRRRVVDTGLQLTIGEVKRRPLYWVLVGTFGFFALFNTGFTFHIVSIFSDKGVSPTQAVSIFPAHRHRIYRQQLFQQLCKRQDPADTPVQSICALVVTGLCFHAHHQLSSRNPSHDNCLRAFKRLLRHSSCGNVPQTVRDRTHRSDQRTRLIGHRCGKRTGTVAVQRHT